jgi:hypothetical protein
MFRTTVVAIALCVVSSARVCLTSRFSSQTIRSFQFAKDVVWDVS